MRPAFLKAALAGLDALSIMERVRHVADALRVALPDDQATAIGIVRAMGPLVQGGFQAVALAEFVTRHGLDDFRRANAAFADLTQYGSAEFAVRPLLARDPERMLVAMEKWSRHANEHVRRLACEGSRPRLPWATRVAALTADPTLAQQILENLRADPSEYVRRSVANHLNDITKDRPDWVIDRLATWPLDNKPTAAIARHALRTLIKQGHPRALTLVGAGERAELDVVAFSVSPKKVRLGDTITLTAQLRSTAAREQRLVVDYRIHYARETVKRGQKSFQVENVFVGKKQFHQPESQTDD